MTLGIKVCLVFFFFLKIIKKSFMGEPFQLSQTARYYNVLSRRCIIQANLESTISTSRNCVKDIV